MRFDEALGINMWTTAALACVLQACAWLWQAHFQAHFLCVLNQLVFGALLFLCGCTVGLYHACFFW